MHRRSVRFSLKGDVALCIHRNTPIGKDQGEGREGHHVADGDVCFAARRCGRYRFGGFRFAAAARDEKSEGECSFHGRVVPQVTRKVQGALASGRFGGLRGCEERNEDGRNREVARHRNERTMGVSRGKGARVRWKDLRLPDEVLRGTARREGGAVPRPAPAAASPGSRADRRAQLRLCRRPRWRGARRQWFPGRRRHQR